MDFDTIKQMSCETERINATYKLFNEDVRLNHSQAARVEFLTTVKYIEKYLSPGSKILDIGAGAGEYCLHFAQEGYSVTAVELADNNIAAFTKKLNPSLDIDLRQGNACDLSCFPSGAFDVVLLLGPLYHIADEAGRQQAIAEARRVCKPGGVIFFAYICGDMVILTETFCYDLNYLARGDYNHQTFALNNFPFVFFNVDSARQELNQAGVKLLHEIAADGVSELLADKINQLDEAGYAQYLRYHFYCCEKPEMLGRSNHLLFVGQN
jgi:2-polyprenyl-3-methyl-5-hydroxy-6-metoxy-1,4-benzoquinol methylase